MEQAHTAPHPPTFHQGPKIRTALSSLGITLGYAKLSKKFLSESTNFELELVFDFIAATAEAPRDRDDGRPKTRQNRHGKNAILRGEGSNVHDVST